MNLSPEWEIVFSEYCEIKHWSRIGDSDTPDEFILQWAKENGHVILTNDLGFGAKLTNENGHTVVRACENRNASSSSVRRQGEASRVSARASCACPRRVGVSPIPNLRPPERKGLLVAGYCESMGKSECGCHCIQDEQTEQILERLI